MAVTAQIISSVGRGILTRIFNPGTTSWTVPTSVGRILTISGKGGDGTSDVWVPGTIYSVGLSSTSSAGPSGVTPITQTWDQYYNEAASYGSSGTGFIKTVGWNTHLNTSNGLYYQFGPTGFASSISSYRNASLSSYGSAPSSGLMTYLGAGNSQGWQVLGEILTQAAAAGAASTIFGQSLPGGASGSPASITNLSNIIVTPGATYSIVNNGNINITITY